jgi:hypothetical protein
LRVTHFLQLGQYLPTLNKALGSITPLFSFKQAQSLKILPIGLSLQGRPLLRNLMAHCLKSLGPLRSPSKLIDDGELGASALTLLQLGALLTLNLVGMCPILLGIEQQNLQHPTILPSFFFNGLL